MSLPEPYYQDSLCTIYHGDCREFLPAIAADVVLTDPPYGLGALRGMHSDSGSNSYASFVDNEESLKSSILPAVRMAIARFSCVVLTPGNRCAWLYPRPDSIGCFYQPAAVSMQRFGNLDCQPILYYGKPHIRGGAMGRKCSWVLTERAEKNGHPCAKPIKAWTSLLLSISSRSSKILDPFMGSGTTLVAAKELGRKAIGIEIEEKYCEIAAKRLSQETLFSVMARQAEEVVP